MLRRPRRNRKSEAVRSHQRETHLGLDNLMYPLFVTNGKHEQVEVESLPGNYRWSIDLLVEEVGRCVELGLHSFVLFPVVPEELKNPQGTYGYNPDNFYFEAFRQLKAAYPDICLMTDVAMDPYNSDGHDGIVRNGEIINDETLEVLAKMAVAQAEAGADIIGPSDMMDGRVGAIREALDGAGYTHVSIMSYSAKYASAFYGPFRDALDSAPKVDPSIPKDKKSYQMDPANKREALIEAEQDYLEGADYLMVKPALAYLDVIHLLKANFDIPITAYNVSGECAMLTAAAQNGWLNLEEAMPEMLLSMRRAGADVILTYFAKRYAELINAE